MAASKPPANQSSKSPPKELQANIKPAPTSLRYPRTVTDGLGRSLTLTQQPQRIVSLAPKNTEELFAIGAGDRVVGVTSYCNYPAETSKLEQIGGFSSNSISLEKIVSLRPDLVVAAGEIHAPVIAELERLNITTAALGADSFDELYAELKTLGTLVGCERAASELVASIESRVRKIQEIGQSIPTDQRLSVFYMTWDDPLTTAGPASYAGQMIELCGAKNIISDVSTRYPQISQEVLLAGDPDVIIAAEMTTKRWTSESLRSKTGWQNLKALREGRLHLLDGDAVSRCGPRLVEVLESMAHAIYPERYPNPTGGKPNPLNPSAESPP